MFGLVELWPCSLIHGQPVSGHSAVQILVADCGTFQLGAEDFGATVCHEMLHRLIDKPAALARSDHAVNGPDGGFRQNDVDAFAHGY
jgi:hypothetical protein